MVEGPDPDRVPEHDLLRERRLRRRGGLPRLLRAQRRRRRRRPRRRCSPGSPRTRASTTRSPTRSRRASAATSCSSRCSSSTTSTATSTAQAINGAAAEARRTVHLPATQSAGGAVLRELRHEPARRQYGAEARVYGGGLQGRRRRSTSGCRRSRAQAIAKVLPPSIGPTAALVAIDVHTGAGARDGRRPQLPPEPVQPRDAGRAPAGLGVQAVRARRRAPRRDLAVDDPRLAPGRDRRRRPALERQQLRGRQPRARSTCRRRSRTPTTRSSRS